MTTIRGASLHDRKIVVTFDSDELDASEFSWGVLEDLQSGKASTIRQMIEEYATIEGLEPGEDLGEYLRSLKVSEMNQIQSQLLELIKAKQNPVGSNGKNSGSGSPSTSSRGKASRR